LLACETWEGEIAVVEIASGAIVDVWPAPGSPVQAFAFSADCRQLLTGHRDSTALLWDLHPGAKLTLAMQAMADDQLWDALAAEPTKAHTVVWTLAQAPERALRVLRKPLLAEAEPDDQQIRRWINDLGKQEFAARQAATQQILTHSPLTEPHLRMALKDGPPLEMRRRIAELLKTIETDVPPSRYLRFERAFQILEMLGTPDARELLSELTKGPANSPRTRVARAALSRIQKR
jgi:hypothetical protein